MTNQSTTLQSNLAERVFMLYVQRHAQQTIANNHAGCTLPELRFIHNYYKTHAQQRLHDAIIQCAYSMLELHRSDQLQ